MKEICFPSLGETWIAALAELERCADPVDGQLLELRNLCVSFAWADFHADPLLARFASAQHAAQMRKVFFSAEPNQFGHSYADRLRGPQGRSDLTDVSELLRGDRSSKRAVATLVGPGDGSVPCINAVHFLCRDGALTATYFARGQDMFHKFYADGLCIYEMAQRVAQAIALPVGGVTGFISSAHVYLNDMEEIRALLARQRGDGQGRRAPEGAGLR